MNNNYIVIGDSITYGIGDFENGGWASLLKKYYVNKDDSKVCKNYVHVGGFPGATSTNISNKIEYIFNSFKDEEFKNTVILSIGVNDTQECNGNNKTSIKNYQNNIQKIIDYLVKQGARLIIVGIARIEHDDKFYWKPNKYYSNQEIDLHVTDYCSCSCPNCYATQPGIRLEVIYVYKEFYNKNSFYYINGSV